MNPQSHWPVFVPSKGRPDGNTFKLLREAGVPYTVFVEPQDNEKYVAAGHESIFCMEHNDAGIAFVRNCIKAFASARGLLWYWTIDDDVKATGAYRNKKNIKVSIREPLEKAMEVANLDPLLAMIGLEYQQFIWTSPKPRWNSFCEVFTAINTQLLRGVHYDSSVNLKEDRDFVVQALSKGVKTMRWPEYGFTVPKMGSNAGGLQSSYKAGKHLEAIEKMEKKWPGICKKVTKKNGVVDLKIDYAFFRPRHSTNPPKQPSEKTSRKRSRSLA